jgi:phosphoglucomutase
MELVDGRRIAVRPSGTEPKIKFYMFGSFRGTSDNPLTASLLPEVKSRTTTALDALWTWIRQDVTARTGVDV